MSRGGSPSGFDMSHTVGLDDRAFQEGLRRTERSASASMSQVGAAIEKKTAGVRKLSGAISSVAGVWTSTLGVIGLVGGAVGGRYAAPAAG